MFTISVDTGGTFTDVVVADAEGGIWLAKALTAGDRAYCAIDSALQDIGTRLGISPRELLARTSRFNYGTTRSTNAVVEGATARTAFFTTAGFPDILLLREGGKPDPFRPMPYGRPYVPRHLTFEIEERIDSDGSVYRPLDEESVVRAIESARAQRVEAVAVCLLWSVANAAHERRVGELLAAHAPELAVTLSHQLNPTIREYRRASATALDASLKPLMQAYLRTLETDLRDAGLVGDLFISTSYGGSWRVPEIVDKPIYSIGSGPSMAPVAAVHYADADLPGGAAAHDLLVTDTGGTTFDVGLVRGGEIQQTGETWLGGRWVGAITGIRAVDVKSIGAGGGSIAWIDSGGLLRVGPRSAGSSPGPACYGRGGTEPTVTDAALLLGYLSGENFLGGRLPIDVGEARTAYAALAERLDMSVEEAAHAALTIATDNIVTAVREATIAQGVDPREVTIVAGGGAAGVNVGRIAAELGTRTVLLPSTAGAMSACGALFSDVVSEFTTVDFTATASLDAVRAAEALATVRAGAQRFLDGLADGTTKEQQIDFSVEARYPQQVWELTVPLPECRLTPADTPALHEDFHRVHERMFGLREPGQTLEVVAWKARATAVLEKPTVIVDPTGRRESATPERVSRAFFGGTGWVDVAIHRGDRLPIGAEIAGPAVIQEPTTTIVAYPGQRIRVTAGGNYLLETES